MPKLSIITVTYQAERYIEKTLQSISEQTYQDFEFILVLFISLFSSVLILNSNDLISLFFIIELQGLTFYVLVASKQTSSFSTESGLKYFILGSLSSSLFLFGASIIYGVIGTTNFEDFKDIFF